MNVKGLLQYLTVLVVLGLGIWLVLERGRALTPRPVASELPAGEGKHSQGSQIEAPRSTGPRLDALSQLLVQLVVILLATRLVGAAVTRFGQPAVVGEMVAGILLGPSLLGLVAPEAFAFLFPVQSLDALKLLSQIGVCLFMFVVGLEFNPKLLQGRAHTAVAVSHASILFPFFLGVLLALALFPDFSGPGISFLSFALFMGVSMSITAFPVLARILQERRWEKTRLGTMALTCAAVDDMTAWSLLAVVIAIVNSAGIGSAALSIGLAVVYVAVMMLAIRPVLAGEWGKRHSPESPRTMAVVLLFLFASALTTELIGIHALIGSFLAGVVMPHHPGFRDQLRLRLGSVSSILLLPLFFAVTGLRTQVGLVNDAGQWGIALLILLVASVGKIVGTLLPARHTGLSWSDAFSLGALMNTRGLMELVVINVGYDLGILSPAIFTLLVLMAIATTVMTGPLLGLVERFGRKSLLTSTSSTVSL